MSEDITRSNKFAVTVTTHSHLPQVDIAIKVPGTRAVQQCQFTGPQAKERGLRWAYDMLYRYMEYPR